jgi:SPP1 family predicted phage head-tail adaptor
MKAGALKNLVSLQSASSTQGSTGEESQTWSTYATAWASISPMAGRELEHASQVFASANYKIIIRHNSSVTPSHRVLWGTRIFEINAVLNVLERNREMELYCKELI